MPNFNPDFPKITYMLMEDILKTYFSGKEPLYFKEPTVCTIDSFQANTLTGVAIHMKKVHKIYTARGDTKRELYKSKDLLPGT